MFIILHISLDILYCKSKFDLYSEFSLYPSPLIFILIRINSLMIVKA